MVAGLTVHWHTDLAEIDAMQWDALTEGVEGGGPFLRLAFLRAMVDSGSACGSARPSLAACIAPRNAP